MGSVILCSGQGAQSRTMFQALDGAAGAEPVFAEARKWLGDRDPRDLVATASDAELHADRTAQLLCATQALAFWSVLKDVVPRPVMIAGYSAGELASWCLAGALEVDATLELVSHRAELMDRAAPAGSGLAVIRGLAGPVIEELCRAHRLHVAIINAADHVLLGGLTEDLQAALREAADRGATRASLLPIALASHTPLLRTAAGPFEALLHEQLADSQLSVDVQLLSGIDGERVRRIDEGAHKLALQICHTIDWSACMATASATHPQCVLELGPGQGLAHMFAEADPDLPVRSVAAFRSVSGIADWLRGASSGG